MDKPIRAKVVYDRIVVFDKPGSTHYVTFIFKGDVVFITKGAKYEERDWKDKQFVEIETKDGHNGYCVASGLTPIREGVLYETSNHSTEGSSG